MTEITLIKPVQAAEALGVTVDWLAHLRQQNRGPRWLRVGRNVRYRPADVAAWLDENASDKRAA